MTRSERRAIASLTLAIACCCGQLAAGQTTVVQRPDGGSATLTIQSDGGNTLVFTQGTVDIRGGGDVQRVVGGVDAGGASGVAGSPNQPPARDQQGLAIGTSRIRGRVLAADTGRPLRRAIVRIFAPGVRESRSTSTDQDGQYEFTQLPSASYTITASRSGYVTMGYKQTRPNIGSRPLPLGERENKDGVDIALPPGGVITGRVVDEYGEPVSDVLVNAQRQQYVNGARRPMPAGAPSSSNDIGEFRLYGLAPGDYYVVASPRAQSSPFDLSTDRTGYGQTYYPSAPDPASAQRITIRSGDILANIVVALTPTRTARVSGIVLDAEGRPARGGNVMIMPRVGGPFPGGNAMVRPDGSFTISGIAPGDFTLRAILNSPGSGPSPQPVFSTANITVSGVDLSNVILQPQAPLAIAGRLTGDPVALAQVQPAMTRLTAVPIGGPMMMGGPMPPPQPLRDDLSFELFAYPGQLAIRPVALTGLVIRAVRLNGRDVTKGFDLDAGLPITDLEVEVTSAAARLTVSAMNVRDEPAADRDIIVFPQDESEWGSQMPGHGSVGRTDQQGRYQSPQLLSGGYYVAATDGLEPGQSNDPDFLESLRARAQRITLGDGETGNVQIQVSDR